MLTLTSITVYPIKSLYGISLQEADVTPRGLRYDRRWMLVDEEGRFLTQRTSPSLALFRTEIVRNELRVFHINTPEDILRLDLDPQTGRNLHVRIWEDNCHALAVSQEADRWFSDRLNRSVQLVYMPENVKRYVDPDFAKGGEITGFSDGFPVLLIGQSSLDDLNSRLSDPVPMDRFRPNLVFSGGHAYQEDEFREIQIDQVVFSVVKSCGRCVMTTVDQSTGVTGKEPLQTLAAYRTHGTKVLFGQNLLVSNTGVISQGAEIRIFS